MSRQEGAAATMMGVYPCLTYRDVPLALSWLREAFGLDGQVLTTGSADREPLEHALLRTAGGATILVEAERPDELHGAHVGQGWIYVAVTDADAHYRQARAPGSHTLGEPHDFGGQYRGYSVRDLKSNPWTFGTARP